MKKKGLGEPRGHEKGQEKLQPMNGQNINIKYMTLTRKIEKNLNLE